MNRKETSDSRQTGLSLIELMIALALSSILSLTLLEVFQIARNSFNQVIDKNEMLDNAQLSFSLLQDSINMAGFFGGVDAQDIDLISHHLSAFPGACDSEWVLDLSLGLQGFEGSVDADDISALPTGCLGDDYVPNSDVMIVRRASVLDPIEDRKLDNKYYEKRFIVRSGFENGSVVFQGQYADSALDLVPSSASVINRLLSIDMYFLEYCNDPQICDASGVGLSRYTLTGNRFVKQRLINGLAQMQFEYGVDLNGNGKVQEYRTAADVSDWQGVLSIRVFALFKGSIANIGVENRANEFKLGSDFELQLTEFERRYKYKKFQSEFSLKNS